MCPTSQAAHATHMKHDAEIPSTSAERASGSDEWRRTPAFGGNKKLGIHILLQRIRLLAIRLRASRNVYRSRDSTGIPLYVQKKPFKRCILRVIKENAIAPEGEHVPCIDSLPPYWHHFLPEEQSRSEARVSI